MEFAFLLDMQKTVRFIQIFFGAGMILAFSASGAFTAASQINVAGGRMSADFRNTPLSSIITDIGAKTGIQFLFLGGAAAAGYNTPFSITFESIPVRNALEKLLLNLNYSLVSDGDDNIRQVFILGSKSAAGRGAGFRPPLVMASNSAADVREEPAGNPLQQEDREVSSAREVEASAETANPEETAETPPVSRGQNIAPGNAGQAVKTNPEMPIRRPGRWSFRKTK